MKCNKCGTPIIPGEKACRICGNTDFSERVKEPEVIDFPDLDLDDKKEEKVNNLPDLMDIIDIEEPKTKVVDVTKEIIDLEVETPVMPELVLDEVTNFEMPEVTVETVNEEISEPIVETTMVPEEEKIENNEQEVKINETVVEEENNTKESVKESKHSKKKNLEKEKEKEVKHKKEPKEPKLKPKKKSSNTSKILLAFLLVCSIGLNVFLFVKDGKTVVSGEKPKTDCTYSKVSYNDYKVTVPSTWITENENNSLLIYDDTQNWSASMKLVDESSYEALSANTESFKDALGKLKYQFTSNYSKSVNGKEFHLFKGKYYEDYSVFVIVTELDEDSLVVVDLKFKGEVDDILLNNVLTAMADIKQNNTDELFKDNFEFVDFTEQVQLVSKEIEKEEE